MENKKTTEIKNKPEFDSIKSNKKNPIIEILKTSAADSTTHGIDHAFKQDNMCIRVFWLICFLASGGVCGFMIAVSILDYLEFDTVTKAEKIYLLSSDFPTVSICNQNQFMSNYSYDYVKNLLISNKIVSPIAPELALSNAASDRLLLYRYFVGTNVIDPANNNSIRRMMGYDISEMLLSCTYNLNTCSANDFDWFYDVYYGNCFMFNNGKLRNGSNHEIRKSTRPGSINGLQVELFLYEPMSVMSLSSVTGARVVVHNRTHRPTFGDGISVATGTLTNIQVTRIFSTKLEEPFNKCSKQFYPNHPSKLVRAFLDAGRNYTQEFCFFLCYERLLVQTCKCYDSSLDLPLQSLFDVTKISSCKLYNQTVCNAQLFSTFFSGDFVEEQCGDECPRECDSIQYNVFTSHSNYPSKVFAKSLMNNSFIKQKYASNPSELTYESLKENMVQIAVHYGDLGYQKFDEVPKTSLVDLIAGIGGTLGLFLGMSFLSFIEAIDVILRILFYKFSLANLIAPLTRN